MNAREDFIEGYEKEHEQQFYDAFLNPRSYGSKASFFRKRTPSFPKRSIMPVMGTNPSTIVKVAPSQRPKLVVVPKGTPTKQNPVQIIKGPPIMPTKKPPLPVGVGVKAPPRARPRVRPVAKPKKVKRAQPKTSKQRGFKKETFGFLSPTMAKALYKGVMTPNKQKANPKEMPDKQIPKPSEGDKNTAKPKDKKWTTKKKLIVGGVVVAALTVGYVIFKSVTK